MFRDQMMSYLYQMIYNGMMLIIRVSVKHFSIQVEQSMIAEWNIQLIKHEMKASIKAEQNKERHVINNCFTQTSKNSNCNINCMQNKKDNVQSFLWIKNLTILGYTSIGVTKKSIEKWNEILFHAVHRCKPAVNKFSLYLKWQPRHLLCMKIWTRFKIKVNWDANLVLSNNLEEIYATVEDRFEKYLQIGGMFISINVYYELHYLHLQFTILRGWLKNMKE